MTVGVRPARAADRPRLCAIQAAAIAEPWPALLEGDTPVEPRLWVLADDRPVGYAAALTAAEPTAYLPEIAIEPARQGDGLGSRLLAAVLEALAADGFEVVRLTAPAGNARLRRFYARHGFEPAGGLDGRFESGDGVVLERRLPE